MNKIRIIVYVSLVFLNSLFYKTSLYAVDNPNASNISNKLFSLIDSIRGNDTSDVYLFNIQHFYYTDSTDWRFQMSGTCTLKFLIDIDKGYFMKYKNSYILFHNSKDIDKIDNIFIEARKIDKSFKRRYKKFKGNYCYKNLHRTKYTYFVEQNKKEFIIDAWPSFTH